MLVSLVRPKVPDKKKPPPTLLADGGLKARFKTAPRASVDRTSFFYSMLYALCPMLLFVSPVSPANAVSSHALC